MKRVCALAFAILFVTTVPAKDKSSTYQQGTYVTANVVKDGTVTDDFHCGSPTFGATTCNGGMQFNQVAVYTIQVADGAWRVETDRQAGDAMLRRLGQTPMHFTAEKPNPLDALKNGDKVMFRVEEHRKIGGKEIDIFIPYADNPAKEAKFVGWFSPDTVPERPKKVTDNVKAMCDAHKLSPELEKQFCSGNTTTASSAIQQNSEAGKSSPAAAAALAEVGHPLTPEESAQLVANGNASRCAVITTPPGAEVYVDGNKGGITPFAFVLMKRGDTPRVITIKLGGYTTVEKKFVPNGSVIPISVQLEKVQPENQQ
jgi:hypothetical protein